MKKQAGPGMVYLVGAGPGEEELITVKGRRLIEEADCIVYDHLANPGLLRFAKPGCEKIYAGKENHSHAMGQDEIHALLAQKATGGRTVVRLKGGDPYVFGRGGEEGLYLKERGIPCQVVPGISSAIAGPAYGGIPVTHRGICQGFHVITAHGQEGQPAKIDYEALARSRDTCVFFMGFAKLRDIVGGLLGAGKNPDCPAAVISSATLPSQRTCVGTLETIVQKVQEAAMAPPALVVVGEVVGLRPFLNFFEEMPLFGKRFLVTKIGAGTSELAEGIRGQGGLVTEIQTGEIKKWNAAVTEDGLSKSTWVVLTSRHGVDAFFESLKAQRIDFRALAHKKFAVVGKKTAQALEGYGFYADIVPSSFHAAALEKELEQAVGPTERILYGIPKGEGGKGLSRLKECYDVEEAFLYENQECVFTIPDERYDGALFTCPSSVKRLFGRLSQAQRQAFETGATEAFSIGGSTTKALEDFGVRKILQAPLATYQDMLSTLAAH